MADALQHQATVDELTGLFNLRHLSSHLDVLIHEAVQRGEPLSVVFCDLADSTTLGERLDPEVVRGVVTRYFDEARATLERHGGTVEKFVGDAVLAVFGVPEAHEDDALRAARAAFEIQAGIEALNEQLARDHGVELVLECTGFFTDRESAQKHIDAGAKRVLISAPAATQSSGAAVTAAGAGAGAPSSRAVRAAARPRSVVSAAKTNARMARLPAATPASARRPSGRDRSGSVAARRAGRSAAKAMPPST